MVAGHAGAGYRHRSGNAGTRLRHRGIRSRQGRRSAALPALFLVLLPPRRLHNDSAGNGSYSEVISTFSRKRVFGYTAVAFSSVAIAVFGFFVWAHHMFIMGIFELCRAGFFAADHAGRRALGHQDIQLGIHPLQRVNYL